uniref:LRRNT domain-containing protein n=1 Tax=Glossina austeni TaxID=7395 RepID=A0A1A9UF73_GLOAU
MDKSKNNKAANTTTTDAAAAAAAAATKLNEQHLYPISNNLLWFSVKNETLTQNCPHKMALNIVCHPQQRAVAFCPSKCQCLGGDANSRAYCIDAALEDVPIQLNPETKYINLTLNKIRNIEFTLPFYMKLEVLDLSRNIIETLGSKNFEYQIEMRTLNLSHNSVSSLQKDAFRGLSNLLVLDLSFNRIEVVHPSAMADLTSLIEMDLTNNNVVSLEENTFHNLMSLEILIFKNNQLLDVPASNLQHLHAIKSLDVSENLVEYVRNDSFEGLRELVTLTLRGNVISELDLNLISASKPIVSSSNKLHRTSFTTLANL